MPFRRPSGVERGIQQDLTVAGHPEIFAVGDTASLDQDGNPLPGVAQVAIQQGRYAGTLIHRIVTGKSTPGPFRYFDKGNMAVVGKGFAVLQSGKVHISGFLAWLAWAAVHLQFLAQSSLRASVFLQWVWTYAIGKRLCPGPGLVCPQEHSGAPRGRRLAQCAE
jgi:NADH dehydrogenase FAD-containing subunit